MLMMKERWCVWRWAQLWKCRKAAFILGNTEDGWLAWCWVPNLRLLKVHNEKNIIAYSVLDLPGFLMVLILTLSSSVASTEFIKLVKEKIRTLPNYSSHNKYNCPCQKCTFHVSYNLFNKTSGNCIMQNGACVHQSCVNQSKVTQARQVPSTNDYW